MGAMVGMWPRSIGMRGLRVIVDSSRSGLEGVFGGRRDLLNPWVRYEVKVGSGAEKYKEAEAGPRDVEEASSLLEG